jgi:hypothetical protein
MEFFVKPDLHLSAAHVVSDFRRIESILQYQPPYPFAENWIAGLCCKRRQSFVCTAVFHHGCSVLDGNPGQAANY